MNATRKYRIVGATVAATMMVAAAWSSTSAQSTNTNSTSRPSTAAAKQPQPLPAPPQAVQTRLPAPAAFTSSGDRKAYCGQLLQAARAALLRRDLPRAEQFAQQAAALRLPEESFGVNEDSPARLAWDLQLARYRNDAAVVPALAYASDHPGARQALHVDAADTTANIPVALETPLKGPRLAQALPRRTNRLRPPASAPATNTAPNNTAPTNTALGNAAPANTSPANIAPANTSPTSTLIDQGEQMLREGNFAAALDLFQQADATRGDLDPTLQSRLDSHLKMLATNREQPPVVQPQAEPDPLPSPANARSLIDDTQTAQQRLARQLSADVGTRQLNAKRLRESDPRGALQLLKTLRSEVQRANVSEQTRRSLLRRVDLAIDDTDKYIEDNRAQIELDEANAAVLAEVERRRASSLKLQDKKAQLVDEFNKLRNEQRFAEAEIVAKRLHEIAGPYDELATVVMQTAKIDRRDRLNRQLRADKEDAIWRGFDDVENAAFPNVGDANPLVYDPKRWGDIKGRPSLGQTTERLTPREIEIQRKLQTPVDVKFRNRPLSEVLYTLAQMTGINIHIDERGLTQEGVTSNTPVNIELTDPVMLKSALNLILEELHLSYLIKDEVLKVTSQQLRDGETYHEVYYVADLVTPIPNFVPGSNFGLQGLINDAFSSTPVGQGLTAPGPVAVVQDRPQSGAGGAPVPSGVLAQQGGFGSNGGGLNGGGGQFGSPPGAGGAADADFDSLIDLIVSTVAAETWAESGGGEAEIRPYPNNLSLVISQTQAVHEQIEDLLDQLRRLQDLQITIEVRFITISDSFFEQIGVDFDFQINDETVGLGGVAAAGFETPARSAIIGLDGVGGVTADLDIPFTQDSVGVAVPQFVAAQGAAQFGFAILSDIEAFFVLSAAQGDSRTNVLDAPKVTLFNGQTAFIADAAQTPFVISVIPVVGEFAAAQQPVIVVLSEGTLMNIQAVVSEDRRYIRLTVVPFFSQITDVDTFTFDGDVSTSTSSSTTDADNDGTAEAAADTDDEVISGTTVQLPTFAFITVATTVSVPDGGTVLLGGIKELDEGRNEFGVPLLSKLPYINRLFRNVGIDRQTSSLMFMVTPRIIIQEEEEERLGIAGN